MLQNTPGHSTALKCTCFFQVGPASVTPVVGSRPDAGCNLQSEVVCFPVLVRFLFFLLK